MTKRRVPLVKGEAEILHPDGDHALDWYTGVLTDGATGNAWPSTLFPYGAHLIVGTNVIALRLWHKKVRILTTWRPHTTEEAEWIYQNRKIQFPRRHKSSPKA